MLLEQHGIIFEDDGELQEELSELKLEDGELEDSLQLCVLEEELMLLLLSDKLLQLKLSLLLEQHGTFNDDDCELHEEHPDWKLHDGELEDSLLH